MEWLIYAQITTRYKFLVYLSNLRVCFEFSRLMLKQIVLIFNLIQGTQKRRVSEDE